MSILVLDQWLRDNLLKSHYVNPGGASGRQSITPVDVSHIKFGGSIDLGGFEKSAKDQLVFGADRKITNPGPEVQTGRIGFTKSETHSVSTSITEGFSISETTEVNFEVKLPADMSIGVKQGVTVEMSGSTTKEQTESSTQEWNDEEEMVCPPYTVMTTTLFVNVADFRAGFTMDGPVTGGISFKVTTYTKDGSSHVSAFDGPIERFIPGMRLPPELVFQNNQLQFRGGGQMAIAEGVNIVRQDDFQPIPHLASTQA